MLTLHFFKLVAVVKIRVYLDFELDESYTPTKMVFLAGMGGNDLVEFATWEGEGPCGWIDVPLEGVGGRSGGWVTQRSITTRRARARKKRKQQQRQRLEGSNMNPAFSNPEKLEEEDGDADDDDDDLLDDEGGGGYDDDGDLDEIIDDIDDPYAGSVLKAMVIQMRVVENHQNGKDTHVRGFQVFAKDEDRRRMGIVPSVVPANPRWARKSLHTPGKKGENVPSVEGVVGLEEPDWMGEPVIR